MDKPTITISEEEYNRLVQQDEWLRALEAAGVDNWQGYSYAQDLYSEWQKEKTK